MKITRKLAVLAVALPLLLLLPSNASAIRSDADNTCRVDDPTSTALNLRKTAPNGRIIDTLRNGTVVRVLEVAFFQGKGWARLGDRDRMEIGWVYRDYLDCQPTAQPSTVPSPNNSQRPRQFDKIFGYTMYDNVVGITFLGPVETGDADLFKRSVLSYLRTGRIVGNVNIYSQGGSTDEAMKIGEQIRLL